MKSNEILAAMESGSILCLGTFLGGKAEVVVMNNKRNGNREPACVIRETVLADGEAIICTRWDRTHPGLSQPGLKGGESLVYTPPVAKGKRVVVKVTGMETQSGVKLLSGSIEPLE